VISRNADIPYWFALLDLWAGPVVLTVPEVADRYYVMQFEDLLGYNADPRYTMSVDTTPPPRHP